MTFGPVTINRPGATAAIGVMGPIGQTGAAGKDGAVGIQGPAVWTPISAWVSGFTYQVGPPASLVSYDGGSYACTTVHTSGVFLTDLAAGLWEPVGGRGIAGPSGTPGSTWYYGVGAPSTSVGINNDYFLRIDTDDILVKVGGSWSLITNIKGLAGNTIQNGSGAPSNSLGANGDFYIDTTNTRIYGPKASGVWPSSSTSLIGSGAGNVNPTGTFTIGDVLIASTTDGKVIQDSGIPATRITGAAQVANNLSDLPNPSAALATLGGLTRSQVIAAAYGDPLNSF